MALKNLKICCVIILYIDLCCSGSVCIFFFVVLILAWRDWINPSTSIDKIRDIGSMGWLTMYFFRFLAMDSIGKAIDKADDLKWDSHFFLNFVSPWLNMIIVNNFLVILAIVFARCESKIFFDDIFVISLSIFLVISMILSIVMVISICIYHIEREAAKTEQKNNELLNRGSIGDADVTLL